MIHYTCDLCGEEILPAGEQRYEVKIEVKFASDPMEVAEVPEACAGREANDEDFDDQVTDLLEMVEGVEEADLENGLCKSFRFDLCPECKSAYIKDPLVRQRLVRLSWSDN